MPAVTTQEIIGSIDDRLERLANEIDTLTAARAALAEDTTGEVSASVATNSKPAAQPRKRTTKVTAAALEQLLADGEELTTAAVAERAGADREHALVLLRELETAGKVTRIGEKRGTKWRVFSEEDWIAQRAAELAARSRNAA